MQKVKPKLTWNNVVHLRLPVGRERLIGNYRTALSIILMLLTVYSFIRGVALLSHVGYNAYQQEFDRVIGGRFGLGIYWLITTGLLIIGLWLKNYFFWRISLISVGIGLGSWALLFYVNRGFRVFDAINSYAAASTLCFAIATLSNDPRPIRQLREKLDNVGSVG